MAILLAAGLSTGCGSEPARGIWDGGFGTGSCSSGMTGQFTCTPDPGSPPANCNPTTGEEAGLELVTLGDFSLDKAYRWYVYIDKSGAGRITSLDKTWEASTALDPFPRCGADGPARAMHIQGGPFYGWGGGFGTAAKDWRTNAPDPLLYCFRAPDSPFCQLDGAPDYLRGAMVNASAYEGVAVWARRGPDSQGGFRVLVGDQNTDDDIAYLTYQEDPTLPRNCERVRECACTNHKACQEWQTGPLEVETPNLMAWQQAVRNENVDLAYEMWSCSAPGWYCEDPAADTIPGYFTTGSNSTRCNTCTQTRCDEQYEAYPNGSASPSPDGTAAPNDAQFNGKPCTPYTSRSGVASAYCFDPTMDPPPAEPEQQCGDHWTRPIYVTNEWHLYLVPFTEMLQQGWAKRFGKMDLEHVTMVRITWDGGYVDFWIGKVAFYRHKG